MREAGKNILIVFGTIAMATAVLGGLPSILLDCDAPGFWVCGPMDLLDYQIRAGLVILSILLFAVVIGLALVGGTHPGNSTRTVYRLGRPRPILFRSKFRQVWGLVLSLSIAAGLCAILVLLPISQSFTMTNAAIYDLELTCGGIDPIAGTVVTFHWSAPSAIEFIVLSCSANSYISQEGSSGSGSFVATGGLYQFGEACPGPGPCPTATVSGSYVGPILPVN